jgi:hypothetical protein
MLLSRRKDVERRSVLLRRSNKKGMPKGQLLKRDRQKKRMMKAG